MDKNIWNKYYTRLILNYHSHLMYQLQQVKKKTTRNICIF